MSKRKVVTAKIEEWDGPIFSEEIDDLNALYDKAMVSGQLEELAKTIPGFLESEYDTITSDGYKWFLRLVFTTSRGKLTVLFPYGQDLKRKGGLELDRSIAIYRQGETTLANAGMILERIQLRIFKAREKGLARRFSLAAAGLKASIMKQLLVNLKTQGE